MKFSYLSVLVSASTVLGQVVYHSGVGTNKCLDGVRAGPGNPVEINDCNNGASQKWLPNISPSISFFPNQTYCIDAGTSPSAGSLVVLNECNLFSLSQKFASISGNLIGLGLSGLCITAPGDTSRNGAHLQLALCNPFDNGQVWRPLQVSRL